MSLKPSELIESISRSFNEITKDLGHIFFIPDASELDEIIKIAKNRAFLTDNQVNILEAIKIAYGLSDNDFTSVIDILPYTKQVRRGVNKTINLLIDSGIFDISITEQVKEALPARSKCIQICSTKTIASIVEHLENKKNVSKSSSLRESTKSIKLDLINDAGLPRSVLENRPKQGLFPSGLPPFNEMLPTKRFKDSKYVCDVNIKGKNVMVEAVSSGNLMHDDDLRIVWTLMTLSINQQCNLIDYYIQKQSEPQNRHYIEIRHILNALGKNNAGSYYREFTNSILRIRATVFNLHELEAVYSDVLGESFFASPQFSFFEECTPISKTGPVVIKDDNNVKSVEIKPFGFSIVWNKTLFKKMIEDNYFFIVPLKILAAPTTIWLIYMYLRNVFSVDKNIIVDMTTEELHEKLRSRSHFSNFKRDMFLHFNTWNKEFCALPKDGTLDVDLQGFIARLSIKDNHITSVRFTCHVQRMLSHIGIKANKDGRNEHGTIVAPILKNPIGKSLAPLLSFKNSRGDEFPSEHHARLLLNKKHLLKGIDIKKASKQRLKITKRHNEWIINRYVNNNTIFKITEDVADGDDAQAAIFTHFKSLRDKLPLLSWEQDGNPTTLSQGMFDTIQLSLSNKHSILVETEELYTLLHSQNQLVRLICCNYTDKTEPTILDNIAMLINSSKVKQGELL
jgi:hypothetical protein